MVNLFKSNQGFSASTFKGYIIKGVEKIPKTLDGKLLQVDEQTYQDLKEHKLMWQNGVLVNNPNYAGYEAEQNAKKQKREYQKELAEIKSWFTANDWKPNKIITGEWQQDDIRWVEYLKEREKMRARQDELNNLLHN